jgi:hypothetical protein
VLELEKDDDEGSRGLESSWPKPKALADWGVGRNTKPAILKKLEEEER